jgi:hypothetical protein
MFGAAQADALRAEAARGVRPRGVGVSAHGEAAALVGPTMSVAKSPEPGLTTWAGGRA